MGLAALGTAQLRTVAGKLIAYVLVPAAFAFLTVEPVLRHTGSLAVEGDSELHGFFEGRPVLDRFLAGEFLKIDLVENFGTPSLGRANLCPFALHAATYLFFEDPAEAAFVNRLLLAALSIAALTLFFSRHLPLAIASLCALLTFGYPGFLHSFGHHSEQGALLFFACVLLAVERMAGRGGVWAPVFLYVSYFVFLSSVGGGGIIVGTPFLVAYAAIVCWGRVRALGWILAVMATAALAIQPHLAEYVRLLFASSGKGISNAEALAPEQAFPSWPLLLASVTAAIWLVRRSRILRQKPDRSRRYVTFSNCTLVLGLGLLPMLAVLWIGVEPGPWAGRLATTLWFSNVFVTLAFGIALRQVLVLPQLQGLGARLIFWTAVLVAVLPRVGAVRTVLTDTVVPAEKVHDIPDELLARILPDTRIAVVGEDPRHRYEVRARKKGRYLGSSGYSAIQDGAFRDYLEEHGLVKPDANGRSYTFSAQAPHDELARFGIRWVITASPLPEGHGWMVHGEFKGWHLYENPVPTSIVYLEDKAGHRRVLQSHTISGNTVYARVPPPDPEEVRDGWLVFTFVAQPGWMAHVNGDEGGAPVTAGPDRMIRVPVDEEVAEVLIDYRPYSDLDLWRSFALSLLLATALWWRRRLGSTDAPPRRLPWRGAGRVIAYGVIPLTVAFLTIEQAFSPPVLPIEDGDEGVHTFMDTRMAIEHFLRNGEFLKINLFNNFGTPTIGEPVVRPFAPHALTYAFLHPPGLAMVLNKFILVTLTIAVLTAFFARYLPLGIASLCALLTFSEPSFLYFFNHHPHQGSVLYFTCALLAMRLMVRRGGWLPALLVYVAFLVFFAGIGVNGVLFGTVFLVAYAVIICAGRLRQLPLLLGLLAAAAVATHAHIAEFFRLAKGSNRIRLSYVSSFMDGASWWDLMFETEAQLFSSVSIYLSWAVVGLCLLGTWWLVRRSQQVVARRGPARHHVVLAIAALAIGLGVLPRIALVSLLTDLPLLTSLPVLRSVNVTRAFWFSSPFLMLAFGFGLRQLLLTPLFRHRFSQVLLWAMLLVALQPRFPAFWDLTHVWWATSHQVEFHPAEMLAALKPKTRMTLTGDPIGHLNDHTASRNQVLGAAGRSIILDAGLLDYLQKNELIELTAQDMAYSFIVAPPDVLARLGIRWLVTYAGDEPTELGWRSRGKFTTMHNGFEGFEEWFLWENPAPVTPFYIETQDNGRLEFLEQYDFGGNEIEIQLPRGRPEGDVVATFVALPGWKAFADGRPLEVRFNDDRMIRLSPSPDARSLRLVYEPYSDAYLWGSLALSVLLAAGLAFAMTRATPRAKTNVAHSGMAQATGPGLNDSATSDSPAATGTDM